MGVSAFDHVVATLKLLIKFLCDVIVLVMLFIFYSRSALHRPPLGLNLSKKVFSFSIKVLVKKLFSFASDCS